MPVELLAPSEIPVPAFPPRKRWTRADCASLEESGLWERERLELIDGELISRMSKKRPHANVQALMYELLVGLFGFRCLNTETTIDVAPADNPTNEPQPDLIVLQRPTGQYKSNPQPADVRLLVEISDSTLPFDLGTKARLYARAVIAEYWVVDVAGRQIIVHRDPRAGVWLDVQAYREGESVSPLAAPDHSLQIVDVFAELSE